MHLRFITRGIQQDVELFRKFMETRTFRTTAVDKEGKEKAFFIQGALRPIQLWEYVFPEEHLDVVLNTLKLPNKLNKNQRSINKYLKMLKVIMKGKKIPKPDLNKGKMFIYKENMQVYGINIKPDERKWVKGLYQEAI